MNNFESNKNNVEDGIESLVNSVETADLDLLKEYAELPENPDYETLSDFIGRHGRGLVTNIIEKAEQARDAIGLSYEDFQKTLLQTLNKLHV
jgi:hypothetical protein